MNSKKLSLANQANLTIRLTIEAIAAKKIHLLYKYAYHAERILTDLQNAQKPLFPELTNSETLQDALGLIAYASQRMKNKRLTKDDIFYLHDALLNSNQTSTPNS
jgi:hypothetical protein